MKLKNKETNKEVEVAAPITLNSLIEASDLLYDISVPTIERQFTIVCTLKESASIFNIFVEELEKGLSSIKSLGELGFNTKVAMSSDLSSEFNFSRFSSIFLPAIGYIEIPNTYENSSQV